MEFDIIRKFFATQPIHRSDVVLGIGDDAALVMPPKNEVLAITTDTLIADVHFLRDTPAFDIGYKALAVNLSDLAAMGAKPAWTTLALSLSEINETWLQAFCAGFYAVAKQFNVQLIGGDLTRGSLAMTIGAVGFVPQISALTRQGAKVGDQIYVTGTLGDAGFALQCLHAKKDLISYGYFLNRLYKPEPRVAIGLQLREFASSAIDISDGFAADLQHILQESQVGACVVVDQLPLSVEITSKIDKKSALHFALTSGDDYELCFTAAKQHATQLAKLAERTGCRITCVGEIIADKTLRLIDEKGEIYCENVAGYEHF